MSFISIVSRIAHDACQESPNLLPEGARWWEELDQDFPGQPEPFHLAVQDRIKVEATAVSDVLIRTAGACLVSGLALPLGYHPKRLREALEDRDFYGPMAESGDPNLFFRPPPRRVEVTETPVRFSQFRPKDGDVVDLSFESPYAPANPRERIRYLRHRANRRVHIRHWRHHDGPRPTIVTIHGFSADFTFVNEWFFALSWLYKLGFDVCLYTLPFHGARQTRFSPFSGHGLFAGGVNRVNECFGQAVFDFRLFMNYLEDEKGVDKVGVMGVSLGGFTSALLASVEPRLQFAIPNVPLASVADLVFEWEPIGAILRTALKTYGLTIRDARHMLAVSSPLTYAPILPRERLFVIGGVGDRLVPPKHSRLLWDHWGRCRIYWFPGSHLIHLDRANYLRQIARFLRKVGFFDGLGPPGQR